MKLLASMGFSMGAFVTLFEILITYVRKKKIKTLQNSFFIAITVFCLLSCLSEFAYVYCISIRDSLSYEIIVIPCLLYVFFSLFCMFSTVGYVIVYRTSNLENKKKKKIRTILLSIIFVIYVICFIIACNSKIELHDQFLYQFVSSGTDFISVICYSLFLIAIFALFTKNKDLSKNQRLPLLYAVIIVVIVFSIQLIFGYDFNYLTYFLTFLLAAIFFTTENQDFKLLEELEESKKVVEDEYIAQSKFIDNILSEIKKPLSNVIGISNILITEDFNYENLKKDASSIHESAMKLLEVTNSISDISLIESGKEKNQEREYQLSTLIDDIYWFVGNNLSKEDIDFSINVDEKLPSKYYGDVDKIKKIIINVLTNAFNYTINGKVLLDINEIERKDKEIQLEFLVFNTGHLMSEKDFSRELQDLFNDDNETGFSLDDNNMSLMVAKRLLEMIDGEIKFVNEKGKGTRYFITLKQLIVDSNNIGKLDNSLYTYSIKKKEQDSSSNSSLEVNL